MLEDAISQLKDGEKPIIHSDRGCHYRWDGWIDRMNTAGLSRSMSKKGVLQTTLLAKVSLAD